MKKVAVFRLLIPYLCLIARWFVSNGVAQSVKCLTSDQEALINFKNGLQDPENHLSSWQGSNCCQWSGISCKNSTGAVVAVDLHNPHPSGYDSSGRYGFWNLSGEVRPSLMKLKSLRYLDLSFNTFNGIPIPIFFGYLENLQYLNLSNAGFSGKIPPNLGNLSSLEYLDLKFSTLTVDNLEWMAGLTSLKHLMMNGVDLSMVGSDWVGTLQKLPVLMELHLSSCGLSDVDLSSNLFEGPIPLPVVEIELLDLSNNRFSGPIPRNIGNITASLGNCSLLRVLDLSGNNLYGGIPYSLGQLKLLQSLHLSGNKLSGELPLSFQNLSSLETLDLGNNMMEGELPSKLSNLSSLQVLDLAENKLSGTIPVSFGDLNAMAQVQIRNQYLFYGMYRGIYYKESLVVNVKGSAQRFSKTLSLVTSIDLSGNNLQGDLPQELTKLAGLVILNLSRNHISGQIPDRISNLRQLSSLDLSNNSLSGPIPPSMSLLSFLGFLNLSYNNFLGTIPYTGHMTTFEATSYAGNPGLCGAPLVVKCPSEATPVGGSIENYSEDKLIDTWFYLSLGLGFAAGILVPYFILAIRKSWRNAYFAFVEEVVDRLCCMRLRRTTHLRNRRRHLH
ncbi:hypothetical protein CMV_015444 [Castanea mollissima]|uniref:Leucine-rich repeat-containing N-terminal plant-type domain-containing protein n=1 Tax=Castanea mollissima TaxID=60419 RepID=A0A8J4VK11_9ROSI|nr:hypothetical protein CMV_015444 [Castanea mollissima]